MILVAFWANEQFSPGRERQLGGTILLVAIPGPDYSRDL